MTNITAEYDAGQGRIEAINHDEDYRKLQSAFWILERLGDLKDEGRAATLDTLLTASVRRTRPRRRT
jgi:hypothetical protein